MENKEFETPSGETKPKDFMAKRTGDELSPGEAKTEELDDAETKFREHRRISTEIEKLRKLQDQYPKAKELVAAEPDDDYLKREMASMADNEARIQAVKDELARTSRFSFRKRSELKNIQLRSLREMSSDQATDVLNKKNRIEDARRMVQDFESQYGSEEGIDTKIHELENELNQIKI